VGSLMTIFLSQPVQHWFWKRQRRADLRFAVVNKINELASEFAVSYVLGKDIVEESPEGLVTFYRSWHIVAAQARVLFSKSTYNAVEHMEVMMVAVPLHSRQEVMDRVPRHTEFVKRRDTALRAMYKEIGIL
jgi:hypothetical protein